MTRYMATTPIEVMSIGLSCRVGEVIAERSIPENIRNLMLKEGILLPVEEEAEEPIEVEVEELAEGGELAIEDFTVKKLKKMLKEKELSVSGNKEDLIERLADAASDE